MSDHDAAHRTCPMCKGTGQLEGTRPPKTLRADTCPPAIIDTDPEGHGLGVWVLVASTETDCEYEYAGGIA